MSCVYFHSPSGETKLRGSERAQMGWMVQNLAVGLIQQPYRADDPIVQLTRNGHLANTQMVGYGWIAQFMESLRLSFSGFSEEGVLSWKGRSISTFSLSLNTALTVGNDAVKLMARLHGQCEIHAYVEGPNRAWLADIMQRGFDTGVCRPSQGWEDVVAFLRERDDEPVVTSYSVCDQFPSTHITDWKPTPDGDGVPSWWEGPPSEWNALPEGEQESFIADAQRERWYDLSDADRWRHSMSALRRENQTQKLELSPEDWDTFHFGHGGLTVLDLQAADWQARVEKALGIVSDEMASERTPA